jgi:hypothetical protein
VLGAPTPRPDPQARRRRLSSRPARSDAGDETPAPRRARWILLVAGFVLTFTLASVLLTLRTTALSASWYQDSVEASNGYQRLYDQVLTDPAVARETRDLLAGLPIDHSLVAANLRIVAPPTALKATVDRTLETMTAYLRGDRGQFDPVFALDPLFNNIRKLADQYLSDTVTNLRPLNAANVEDFAANAYQFANDLGNGRKPKGLPTVAFDPDQADLIAGILLSPLTPADQARLQLPVMGALHAGDLGTALATVAPAYGSGQTERVIVDLQQDETGTHFHVDGTVTGIDKATVTIDLSRIRLLTGTLLPILLIGSLLAAGACLVALSRAGRRSGRSGPLVVATTVIVTGLVVAVVYLVVRLAMGDPFAELFGRSDLPPALNGLLHDLATNLFHGLDTTFVEVILVAVVPAAAVVLWVAVAPRVIRQARTLSRRQVLTTATVLAIVLAVALTSVFVATAPTAEARRCNGHAELCNRRYDDVAFTESHNAMSATDLGWLGANQDVPMPEQLNAGVRVLHIDTRYWETPDVTASFASTLPPDLAGVVLDAAAAANPVRPGVWLCHSLCRLGATKLETGLSQVLDFLRSNPNEVVTLDIEDKVSAADTVAVIRKSGLSRYIYTPGDPTKPWPTLGQMIKSGHRLVVFAENHGGSPRWYASLYKYAMETPFTFTSPSLFSCVKNRGGTNKRLFVMNNFITRAAPSRNDAAAVNASAAIVRRARQCAAKRGRMPNFINVDFSTLGDVPGAVDTLNRVPQLSPP